MSSHPTADFTDFKVADLSLAEHEMPGLTAIRREYAKALPLAGARITGSVIVRDEVKPPVTPAPSLTAR